MRISTPAYGLRAGHYRYLFKAQGLSRDEIAAAYSVTIGAVNGSIWRVEQKLRAQRQKRDQLVEERKADRRAWLKKVGVT